jgi:uncharacterized membrane protein YkoI
MKLKHYLIVLAFLSAESMIGNAFGATIGENDATAIKAAKIDLREAVTAAEHYIGGTASRAEFEQHKGQWVFDVEVVKQAAVMDVKVDAGNGRIIEATTDKTDHDDAGDLND